MKTSAPSFFPCPFLRLRPEFDIGYGVRVLVEEDDHLVAKSALLTSTLPDPKRGYPVLLEGAIQHFSSHQLRMDHNAPGVAAELARYLVHALYQKPPAAHPAVYTEGQLLVIEGRRHTLVFSRLQSGAMQRRADAYVSPTLKLSGVGIAVATAAADYLAERLEKVRAAA